MALESNGREARPGSEAERAATVGASRLVGERIRSPGGWRAEALAEVRRLIHEADPEIVEECKWIKPICTATRRWRRHSPHRETDPFFRA